MGIEYASDIDSAGYIYTAKVENDSADGYFKQYVPSLDQTFVIGAFVGFDDDGIAKFENGDYCEPTGNSCSGTVEFVDDCDATELTISNGCQWTLLWAVLVNVLVN